MNSFFRRHPAPLSLAVFALTTAQLTAGVSFSGSSLSNYPGPGDFYVGEYGAGSLTIDNGSAWTATDYGIIGYAAGSSGIVSVTGAGSQLNVGPSNYFPELEVAYSGTGTLNVSNGGSVNVVGQGVSVGFGASNVLGTVNVSGVGSTLSTTELAVAQGSFNITAGGSATSAGAPIAIVGDGAAAAALSVAGPGSSYTSASNLEVGYNGHGSFTVTGGASASSASAQLGFVNSTGTATVTASTWNNTGVLDVGYGGNGNVLVQGGGRLTTVGADLGTIEPGPNTAGTGTLTLVGSNSTVVSSDSVNVGQSGTGTLNVLAGASLTSGPLDTIAQNAGSAGNATVSGSGSTWTNSNNLFVGNSGNGTLTISGGGTVNTAQGGYVGFNAGSTGQVNVDGAGSTWAIGLDGRVGFNGNGTLNVTNGGAVTVGAGALTLGGGGTGTVLVDGNGSSLVSTGGIVIGVNNGGAMTVSNGGNVVTNGLELGAGFGPSSLTVNDAFVSSSGNVSVGYDNGAGAAAMATLTLKNGGGLSAGSGSGTLYLGNGIGGLGTLNIGGDVAAAAAAPAVLNAAAVVGLSNGSAVQFNTTSGSLNPYYFSSNGGASGAPLGISGYAQIINTAGYNILTGTNSTLSGIAVNGGTLGVAAGASLQNGPFFTPTLTVAAGATLANDGTLTNTGTAQNNGTISGAGGYVQTSGSTVNAGSFSQTSLMVTGGSFTQTATGATSILGDTFNAASVTVQGDVFSNAGLFTNSGTLEIDAGATLMTGGFIQDAGSTLLNGGTIDPPAIEVDGGTFGGYGTVDGNLNITAGEVDVGSGTAQTLMVNGSYNQSGGEIIFDIFSTGGVFTESMLMLDGTDSAEIANSVIEFDFLGGADFNAFWGDGLFNLNTFFGSETGDLFSDDYYLGQVFANDVFVTNYSGVTITGFDPGAGALYIDTGSAPAAAADGGATLVLLGGAWVLLAASLRRNPLQNRVVRSRN